MFSSERIFASAAGSARNRMPGRTAPVTSPHVPVADGQVLRGSHPRPASPVRRATAVPGPGAGAVRHGAGPLDDRVSEADEILRRLHQAAEEKGYRAGLARAETQLAAAIAAAGAVSARLEADAPAERAAVARWVADLSLAIARRVLGNAVAAEPALMARAVERAVGVAAGSSDVRVLLHPQAVAPVRDAWEAAFGPGYLGKRWTFGPDPTLPPTGCIVRYQHGVLDAGIDAQLEAIAEAVTAAIGGGDETLILEPAP